MVEQKTEKELVRLAARGDRDAYRVLVERYQSRAYAIAFEIVRTREDAEDIVQESFVKAFMSLPKFKGQSAFYTWLYRIVYNMAIDFKRKFVRRGGHAADFDEIADQKSTLDGVQPSPEFGKPDDAYYRGEQREMIVKSLSELSEEHRAVLIMREVDGFSYDEIAQVVGISKGTVMSRLHYARKKMQKSLSEIAPSDVKDIAEDDSENKDLELSGMPLSGLND